MKGIVRFKVDYPKEWSSEGRVRELSYRKAIQFIDYLRNEHSGYVAFDTETESLAKINNKLASVQFSIDDECGYVICLDYKHNEMTKEQRDDIKLRLKELFESKDTDITWVGHNIQFDICQVVNQLKVKYIARPIVDTMLYIHLLDENRMKPSIRENSRGEKVKVTNGLKSVCDEFFDFHGYDKEAVEARSDGSLLDLPKDKFITYAGMDGYVSYRLVMFLDLVAEKYDYKEQAHRLHTYLYSGVMQMLCWISCNGFYVDSEHLKNLLSDKSPIIKRLVEIQKWYRSDPTCIAVNKQLVDEEDGGTPALFATEDPWLLDLNKPKHKEMLFFTSKKGFRLKPVVDNKTKGKYPTGKLFQAAYKDVEVVRIFSEEQELKKLKSSYLDSIWRSLLGKGKGSKPTANEIAMALDSVDGAVHPNFRLNGTVTGRLSVRDPNVQQVPRSDNMVKKQIKCLYRARPSGDDKSRTVLVQADFCANEIRFWAAISGDPYLCECFDKSFAMGAAFRANPTDKKLEHDAHLLGDIHKQTAALMFGVDVESVTKDMRQSAKSLSLGIMYQRGTKSVAQQLGKPEEEVEELFDKFFKNYSVGVEWANKMKRMVNKYGYVVSPLGRVRHLGTLIRQGNETMARARKASGKEAKDLFREASGYISRAERQAVNSPIQGLASDVALVSLMLLHRYILKHEKSWKIVNSVHDSVVLEIPEYEVPEAAKVIREIFTEKSREYVLKYFGWKMPTHVDVDFEIGQLRNRVCPDCGAYVPWQEDLCKCAKTRLVDKYKSEHEAPPADDEDAVKAYNAAVDEYVAAHIGEYRGRPHEHELNMGYGTLVGWDETEKGYADIHKGISDNIIDFLRKYEGDTEDSWVPKSHEEDQHADDDDEDDDEDYDDYDGQEHSSDSAA